MFALWQEGFGAAVSFHTLGILDTVWKMAIDVYRSCLSFVPLPEQGILSWLVISEPR